MLLIKVNGNIITKEIGITIYVELLKSLKTMSKAQFCLQRLQKGPGGQCFEKTQGLVRH